MFRTPPGYLSKSIYRYHKRLVFFLAFFVFLGITFLTAFFAFLAIDFAAFTTCLATDFLALLATIFSFSV